MNENRHAERRRSLENRPEILVIEVLVAGSAADHRPLQSEVADGALDSRAASFGAAVGSAANP